MKIQFYCRESKVNREGLSPIEVSISINGVRKIFSLDRKCKPNEFIKAMNARKDNRIKEYVNVIRRGLEDLEVEVRRDSVLCWNYVKNYLKEGRKNVNYVTYENLVEAFKVYLTTKSHSRKTYERYVYAMNLFLELGGIANTCPVELITINFISKFQQELEKRYSTQTLIGIMKRIKALFTYAFNEGLMERNIVHTIKMPKVKNEKILWLTDDELNKIESKVISIERLSKVRDLFVFCCFTGLAFVDLSNLECEDFRVSPNGLTYIDKNRTKSDIRFTCVVLPKALSIAKKYNYNLPKISNQKYNAYLKELGTICGISKNLTSHMARHTACRLYINHRPEIPTETILRTFGWTNPTQMKKYAELLNNTLFEDMKKVKM